MQRKSSTNSYSIYNINIHIPTLEQLEAIFKNILHSETNPQLIITFNLDFLHTAYTDLNFRNICNNSLYNLPDGFGIKILIRLKYKKIIERITGNDIFPLLLNLAKKNNKKVAIVGGSEKALYLVEKKIRAELDFKKENILCISPPFNFETDKDENDLVIKKVSTFEPDILFLALGCPRQEKWLFNNMHKFGSKINIGIGATLDFYSKNKRRSPFFLQQIGLEWLWRLSIEPKRLFGRYILNDLPFFIKTIFRKY